MTQEERLAGTPSVPRIIALVGSIMVLSFGLVFGWVTYTHQQEQIRCERSVEGRLDNRAMWEYLIDTVADPADPKTVAFVKHLNERLPVLECVNRQPTAVTDPVGEN